MLSRFVVSQVKHNSYFLVGLALGLWLALAGVPLGEESCAPAGAAAGSASGAPRALDEYEPVREERPLGAAGAPAPARSLQRPRYYSTELGIRAPLLAAALSSEDALGENISTHSNGNITKIFSALYCRFCRSACAVSEVRSVSYQRPID